MFEGIFFLFPKLGFLIFVFLGCEALCPLRSTALYFPYLSRFAAVGVRRPLWHWISKWAMISFFVIALMSPVREHTIPSEGGGYDIVLALDPSALEKETLEQIGAFIDRRPEDRIGVWVPDAREVIIPLTREHDVLRSLVRQLASGESRGEVTREINRFFADSAQSSRWVVVVTETPKSFVHALSVGIELSVVSPQRDAGWGERIDREHPAIALRPVSVFFDFYYVYPLFLGFLAMLIYLYGRNQKGLK